MSRRVKRLYEFGPFLLDPAERTLRREGEPVPLTPKVLDMLVVLVENSGRLLNKKDLMEAVWPDSFVEEGNLSFNVSSLRKALGEDPKEPLYIETVPRRGYRFTANVRVLEEGGGEERPDERPRAQMVQADGVASGLAEAGPRASNDHATPLAPVSRPADETAPPPHTPRTARTGDTTVRAGRRVRMAALVALAAVAGVSLGLYALIWRKPSGENSGALFRELKVTRLTTTRNATDAAISPDGKYVVYVVDEAQRRSLWIRQVATNSHVQIIPPTDVYYLDLFFSHDSDYINYVRVETNSPPALYQVPVPGGAPRKLMDNMSGPIGLSPDGKRFSFVRGFPDGEVALMVANAFDGSGERKLITRRQPGFLYSRTAWSPDGRTIACIEGSVTPAGRQSDVVEVSVADGSERRVTSQPWKFASRVAWLSDGSGLLITVSDYGYGPYQIWHVSYPGGEAQRVTSDLSNYRGMSMTSDSKTLVAVQSDIHPFVWVWPGVEGARPEQLTSGPGTVNDYWGFSWTPDAKIVYVSTLSGNQDVWMMNADGSDQKQLTYAPQSDFDPAVSPDGRHVLFVSDRSGNSKIWRMDIDGGNPKQLTVGDSSDFLPGYSPDGRWVFYTSDNDQRRSILKVPADGGEPQQITRASSAWPAVSPDGRLVACWHINERTRSMALAIVPAEGGEPVRFFDISPTANTWAEIRWTAGGRGLAYVDAPEGVGNVWLQPVAGGPPTRLTDFKDGRLFRFDFSRDGKRLACSRGVETNDVVLISGLR
jgi:eukaryotic-like serine/threonine-protein kinase